MELKMSSGVVFKLEGKRFFTDSEWVIATDINFDQPDSVFKSTIDWLEKNLALKTPDLKNEFGIFKITLNDAIKSRSTNELAIIKQLFGRYQDLKQSVTTNSRKKRGVIDGGGKILN